MLQSLGYLASDAAVDGVYGAMTRNAITAWQRATGRPETGFISDSDATLLINNGTTTSPPTTPWVTPEQRPQASTAPPHVSPEIVVPPGYAMVPPAAAPTPPITKRDRNPTPQPATPSAITGDTKVDSAIFMMLIGGVLAITVYFLPAIIGSKREISSSGALFFVNLFFGWTVLGWLICFLWAATGATRAQDAFFKGNVGPAGPSGPNPMDDPAFREAYAKERARLDHLAGR
jgi:hypothetical protein